MQLNSVLVVGAGIGGLTVAIAMRRKGFAVDMVERDPEWGVYGVGITQQFNVIRAMASLDLLDAYLEQAQGFDRTTLFGQDGSMMTSFETPRLAGPEFPSNAGVRRSDFQKVLGNRALELGAKLRLGVTADRLDDDGEGVDVTFSDGTNKRYDIVVGADGIFSQTRRLIMPDAPEPRYTGQWVWRYNLPQQVSTDEFQIFHGPCNAGLVPLARGMTYVFILSEEAADYRLEIKGAAAEMRRRAVNAAPQIRDAAEQVVEDAGVVGRPLEVVFLDGAWHKGRVVLLGDAVHASTPHLGQGAGMAIEDAIVLTEELERAADAEAAFTAYRARRFERVQFIVENSIRIGDAQMRKIPPVNVGEISGRMMGMMAQPI